MIKTLVPSDDPILHNRIAKCSYNLDRFQFSSILLENMKHYEGVGLSANQIGIAERVFIMYSDLETKDTITCYNPRILKESKEQVKMQEGCLSYPDMTLDIDRSATIVVKYETEDKKPRKEKLTGLIARIFLHEYDHMEGIDFTQRADLAQR